MTLPPLTSERLAPCPFCGKPADFEEIESKLSTGVVWSVGCNTIGDCGEDKCFGYMSATTFNTKREAAKAWNQRLLGEAGAGPAYRCLICKREDVIQGRSRGVPCCAACGGAIQLLCAPPIDGGVVTEREFTDAVINAIGEISVAEAQEAIAKYRRGER